MGGRQALRVAIQGIEASFHDAAVRKFFASASPALVCCATFRRVCQAVERGEADLAVMAIENTIAGSILPNYALIDAFGFDVVGEVYLRVELCLLGKPGSAVGELEAVESHPMALLQCDEYLASLGVKVVEGEDTAASARKVAGAPDARLGAVASQLAARTYGLDVLAESIETNKQNYTRFLVLQAHGSGAGVGGAPDKSSLRIEVPHRAGGLVDVLTVLRTHELNMTKIQSLPLVGRPYQYAFHVDVEWDSQDRYEACLEELRRAATGVREYGRYPRGTW